MAEESKPGAEKPADPAAKQPPKLGGETPPKPAAKPPPKLGGETPPKPAAKPPPKKKVPTVMEVSPWESPLVDSLRERFGDQIKEFSTYRDQSFLVAELSAVVPIIEFLKLEQDFDYLVDVTAVDYPKRENRFDLIWILYSFARNTRIRIKAQAGEGDSPATVTSAYRTANWLEREVFDMFGITFDGHPNMTRILLPDEWQGYPLRKEYSIIQQDEDWVRENLHIESAQ